MRARSVHLVLFAAQVSFASLAVIGRETVLRLPPALVPMVRTLGGALVFYALAKLQGAWRWPARADVSRLLACALFGVLLNQELFIHALPQLGAIRATVMGTTIPLFTMIFAVVLGLERWSAVRGAGMLLALSGVVLLIGFDPAAGPVAVWPAILVLANAASYALYLVLVRSLRDSYPPTTLIAYMFLVAAPVTIGIGAPHIPTLVTLAASDYARLGFLIAVPTVLAYLLVQLALRHATSSTVATYVYLQPILASLGAALRLAEYPTLRLLLYSPLVIVGVFVATHPRWARARVPTPDPR